MTWQLKSQAIQISQGDNNTYFFHKYANFRRNLNYIWDMEDGKGNLVHSLKDFEKLAYNHFFNQFRDNRNNDNVYQIKVIRNYPAFFSIEDGLKIGEPVTIKEIEGVLKQFAKYKS